MGLIRRSAVPATRLLTLLCACPALLAQTDAAQAHLQGLLRDVGE